jgi:two-component system chemotaxis response regulator CheY
VNATILIVEDIEEIRSTMRLLLEMDGYRVIEATGAWEALARAEETRPDLIMTDFDLPTLVELVRTVREHAELASVPIVIVEPDKPEHACMEGVIVVTDIDDFKTILATHGPRAYLRLVDSDGE